MTILSYFWRLFVLLLQYRQLEIMTGKGERGLPVRTKPGRCQGPTAYMEHLLYQVSHLRTPVHDIFFLKVSVERQLDVLDCLGFWFAKNLNLPSIHN